MSEFLFGVPRRVHLAHLQRERDSGAEWTDAAACVAILLDLDKGASSGAGPAQFDLMRYGRQWRWNVVKKGPAKGERNDEAGRSRVRRRWPELVAEVLGWLTRDGRSDRHPLLDRVPEDWWQHVPYGKPPYGRSSYGRSSYDRATTGERPRYDRENVASGSESQPYDRATTALRPGDDRLTEQTSEFRSERESASRASTHEAGESVGSRPGGACYASPAVGAYHAVTGEWPAVFHAEAVARRFDNADPTTPEGADLLTAWAEHVTTYHVSETRNARNLPGMIQTFDEQLQRTTAGDHRQPRTGASPARRAGGSAESDARNDPSGTHARALAVGRAALGLEP